MKTWPYKRDGASLERDNLVVFYYFRAFIWWDWPHKSGTTAPVSVWSSGYLVIINKREGLVGVATQKGDYSTCICLV